MNTNSKGKAVITGASSGIGAIAATRLAKRGHDLILVARDRERLDAVATRIGIKTGRSVEVVVADLNERADLAHVEELLRNDTSITALVNNAGVGAPTPLLDANVDRLEAMIDLNVTALVRLTYAVLPGFLERSGGAIINIASVLGVVSELLNGGYGGTKAFVIEQLTELFRKARELYPDYFVRTDGTLVSGADVIAQWTLQFTITEPFYGGLTRRLPISIPGVSIERTAAARYGLGRLLRRFDLPAYGSGCPLYGMDRILNLQRRSKHAKSQARSSPKRSFWPLSHSYE